MGSYFPSWMLCGLIGILAAAVLHATLSFAGIDEFVPAKIATYSSVAVAVTFTTWLLVFAN